MQPPTDGPRAGFTAAQVAYLIENSPSFNTDMGLQLIDMDGNILDDFSEFMSECTVGRSNFATLHGTCTLSLDAALDWGNTIVRPYMTFTGPISSTATALTTMVFYLGAYFVDTPEEDMQAEPPTWDATGYDVLSILDDYIGDDYHVDTGVAYLARVEQILLERGVTRYVIDQDASARILASPKVYSLDENPTWLQVVNDLLAGVGYSGIWSDWNGALRCHAYTAPLFRPPEWYLTADVANTLLTQRRKRSRDFYDAPNRWVFYQSNVTETQPVDGNGRYEYINEDRGETSVEARGGRTITKTPEGVDVADQASLEAYAQRVIAADMQIPTKVSIDTAPFPLVWHFDKYAVSDPQLGAAVDVVGQSWSLNLNGSDMAHEWSIL
jgi:hypothetical protein